MRTYPPTLDKPKTLSEQFAKIEHDSRQKVLNAKNHIKMPVDTPAELERIINDSIARVVNEQMRNMGTLIQRELTANAQQNINPALIDDLRLASLRNAGIPIRPPRPFSGTIGENFSDWFTKFEQFLTVQGVKNTDGEIKKACLESYLTGTALAALEDLKLSQTPPTTYDAIKLALQDIFPDNKDCDLHQQYLIERRQKLNETVTEFLSDLKCLAKNAYPDLNVPARENIIRPIFLRGLTPSIRENIKYREFLTLSEAQKDAIYIESQKTKDDLLSHSSFTLTTPLGLVQNINQSRIENTLKTIDDGLQRLITERLQPSLINPRTAQCPQRNNFSNNHENDAQYDNDHDLNRDNYDNQRYASSQRQNFRHFSRPPRNYSSYFETRGQNFEHDHNCFDRYSRPQNQYFHTHQNRYPRQIHRPTQNFGPNYPKRNTNNALDDHDSTNSYTDMDNPVFITSFAGPKPQTIQQNTAKTRTGNPVSLLKLPLVHVPNFENIWAKFIKGDKFLESYDAQRYRSKRKYQPKPSNLENKNFRSMCYPKRPKVLKSQHFSDINKEWPHAMMQPKRFGKFDMTHENGGKTVHEMNKAPLRAQTINTLNPTPLMKSLQFPMKKCPPPELHVAPAPFHVATTPLTTENQLHVKTSPLSPPPLQKPTDRNETSTQTSPDFMSLTLEYLNTFKKFLSSIPSVISFWTLFTLNLILVLGLTELKKWESFERDMNLRGSQSKLYPTPMPNINAPHTHISMHTKNDPIRSPTKNMCESSDPKIIFTTPLDVAFPQSENNIPTPHYCRTSHQFTVHVNDTQPCNSEQSRSVGHALANEGVCFWKDGDVTAV